MTPEEEATFIALWQQGLTTDVIAQRLGIKEETARRWAYTLQQHGKIATRPKGGRRSHSRAVHASVQNNAELLLPAALAAELTRLWAAIDALRHDLHRPVQDTVQSRPEPLFEDAADNTTESGGTSTSSVDCGGAERH